jgi:hypothetical protein
MGKPDPRDVSARLDGRVLLGWREWLALPDLGIPAIRAKIDSGARSSALHVDAMGLFKRDGAEWVAFALDPDKQGRDVRCEAPVVDRRPVTDSGGQTTVRIFIRTRLAVAGREREIEVNLTSRRNMLFPMLLGRTAMAGLCLVDPAASFLLGQPESPDTPS